MGAVFVTIEVVDWRGERSQRLNALVSTRATFTQIPASVLKRLGVTENREVSVRSATGEISREQAGEVRLRLEGREFLTPVLFCGDAETPVVGIVALGTALLSLDEATGQLMQVPARTKKWLPLS